MIKMRKHERQWMLVRELRSKCTLLHPGTRSWRTFIRSLIFSRRACQNNKIFKRSDVYITYSCSALWIHTMAYLQHGIKILVTYKIVKTETLQSTYPFCKTMTISCLAPPCPDMDIILFWWLCCWKGFTNSLASTS